MQKSIWIKNLNGKIVVVWKEASSLPFARVYSPINGNGVGEIIELIQNIHEFRTSPVRKTTKELREKSIKVLEDSVRLGQIAREMDFLTLS